jgi:hypothetical protein
LARGAIDGDSGYNWIQDVRAALVPTSRPPGRGFHASAHKGQTRPTSELVIPTLARHPSLA